MTSLEHREASAVEVPVPAPPAITLKKLPRALASKILPVPVKRFIRSTLRNLRSVHRVFPLIWLGARNGLYLDCFSYDVWRYWTHSGRPDAAGSRANLRAKIVMYYHKIERGLSLRDSRPAFGVSATRTLIDNLRTYLASYGADETTAIAISALREYEEFNRRNNVCNPIVRDALIEFKGQDGVGATGTGGTLQLTREGVHAAAQMDLMGFFTARHSVRHYSGEAVELSLLQRAIQMATYSPSVCNRQSGRVHIMKSAEAKREALKWQNGNRGFGDQIDTVLIVTSEVGTFVDPTERYQAWVDGGLFSMSLVYALHSLGLGTCCLNWEVAPEVDRGLRRGVQLPDSETVIMMIAVGHLPEDFSVAMSTRNSVESITTIH